MSLKNWRGRNASKLILWSQHHPDTKTRKKTSPKEKKKNTDQHYWWTWMQKSMVPRASLRLARGWVSPSAATGNPRGRGCQGIVLDRSFDFVPLQNQGDFFLRGSQAQSSLKTIKRGKTESLPSNVKDSSNHLMCLLSILGKGNGGAIDRQTPAQTRHWDHTRHQEEKSKTTNALDSIQNQSAIGIYPREMTFVHTKVVWTLHQCQSPGDEYL